MALTVNAIVDRASGVLQDVGAVRFSAGDLIKYISDGQRRTVALKPEAYAVTGQQALVAGCKQSIPTGGLLILDCTRNITTGNVVGRAITLVDRQVLDQEDPNWQRHKVASQVEHWCYDPKNDPKVFWVYPPPSQVGTQQVELTVSMDPPELTAGQTPVIDPRYHEALIHYAVAMAIVRDSEFGDQMNRAQYHAQAFMTGIGIPTKVPTGKGAVQDALG